MRPIFLFLCFFAIFAMPVTASAQEDLSAAEDTQEEIAIYSRATDAQLSETQDFYQRCRNNPVLKREKNCKCYATKYLETRLAVGNNASVRDILRSISPSCNNDDLAKKALNTSPQEEKVDLSNVSDKDLKEAHGVFEECKNTLTLSRNFDCECLGAKFLNERLRVGPWESRTAILQRLQNNSCPNVVEMTGREYMLCMSSAALRVDDLPLEQKDFCTCYAGFWGKAVEKLEGVRLTTPRQHRYRMQAMTYCRNTGNYTNQP